MLTISQAMKQAKSNLEIEGVQISKEPELLIQQLLRREISETDYHSRVLEIVKK